MKWKLTKHLYLYLADLLSDLRIGIGCEDTVEYVKVRCITRIFGRLTQALQSPDVFTHGDLFNEIV